MNTEHFIIYFTIGFVITVLSMIHHVAKGGILTQPQDWPAFVMMSLLCITLWPVFVLHRLIEFIFGGVNE